MKSFAPKHTILNITYFLAEKSFLKKDSLGLKFWLDIIK